MARLEHVYSYSLMGDLNQRTKTLPVNGLTLRDQMDREMPLPIRLTLIMWLCVVCIVYHGGGDPSGEQQISDAVNDFAILHHGVTQPVFHPSV